MANETADGREAWGVVLGVSFLQVGGSREPTTTPLRVRSMARVLRAGLGSAPALAGGGHGRKRVPMLIPRVP